MTKNLIPLHPVALAHTLARGFFGVALCVGLTGLVACSDDDSEAGLSGGGSDGEVTGTSTLTVITDPADMPVEVTNFLAPGKKAQTRADDPSAFEMPEIPTDATVLTNGTYTYIRNTSTSFNWSGVYVVNGTAELGITVENYTLANNITIYVPEGATFKLCLPYGLASGNLKVYNYGTFQFAGYLSEWHNTVTNSSYTSEAAYKPISVALKNVEIYSVGTNNFFYEGPADGGSESGTSNNYSWRTHIDIQDGGVFATTTPVYCESFNISGTGVAKFYGSNAVLEVWNENEKITNGTGSDLTDLSGTTNFHSSGPIFIHKDFKVGSQAFMCAVRVDGQLTVPQDAAPSFGYVIADTLTNNGGTITLRDGGYLGSSCLTNDGTILANTNDVALVEVADNIYLTDTRVYPSEEAEHYPYKYENGAATPYTDADPAPTSPATLGGSGTYSNLYLCGGFGETAGCTLVSSKESLVVTDDDCAPIFVTAPKSGDDVVIDGGLERIGRVITHSHAISATCIQIANGKAYVSWHDWDDVDNKYGDAGAADRIWGCVEVIKINADNKVDIEAYAEDKTVDYNHILVDGSTLLVAGHVEKKGGVIGKIELTNGAFTSQEASAANAICRFVTVKGNRVPHADDPTFYAGDVNCVIKNSGYYLAASVGTEGATRSKCGGLSTLNADLSRYTPDAGAKTTASSAKHIAITKSGKVVTLNLAGEDDTKDLAELNWYASNDYTWATPTVISAADDDIHVSPVDGKNVVAADPEVDEFYVCYGHRGLRRYRWCQPDGKTENYHSVAHVEGYTPINGVAVGKAHVYVAGGGGLFIFAKSDLEGTVTPTPVAYFRYKNQISDAHGRLRTPSCNYVAIDETGSDILVYLAYGLDGVEILKFNGTSVPYARVADEAAAE